MRPYRKAVREPYRNQYEAQAKLNFTTRLRPGLEQESYGNHYEAQDDS